MSVEELPHPHDLDLERALLGIVLLKPDSLATLSALIAAEDFFRLAHQRLWQVYVSLAAADVGITLYAVRDALAAAHGADEMSMAELATLDEGLPRQFDVVSGAVQLRDLAERRRLIRLCRTALHDVADAATAQGAAESVIAEARTVLGSRSSGIPLSDAVDEVLDQMDTPDTSYPTGLPALDRWGGGLRPGELVYLAGRPSMGKTALALHVARALAQAGHQVWIASLEMTAAALSQRLLAAEARVDFLRLRRRALEPDDYTAVTDASARLRQLPILVDDAPGVSLTSLRRAVTGGAAKGVLIVDYLQLLTPPRSSRSYGSRTHEVGALSRGLKALAHETGVAVLALSQLNRQSETRSTGEPQLSDLRDSGELEQDADQVWLIWRPWVLDKAEPETRAVLKVAKHRNGPTGVMELYFVGAEQTFREATLAEMPVSTPETSAAQAAQNW